MTSTTTAGRPQRSRLSLLIRELWFQVVLAAVLGIAVGILAPGLGEDLKPLNDWFIALVKMIVIPVVFCVVTTGIASMDNLRKAGRIGVKAIGYFLVLSLASMLIGLVVANIFQPGSGLHVDPSSLNADDVPETATEHATFTGFVSSLIPASLLGAITGDAILSALMVSIVFGVALNMAGEEGAPLTRGIKALSDVVFRIVGWVMRLAPLGTFGALATVVATYGAESLKQLGYVHDPDDVRLPAAAGGQGRRGRHERHLRAGVRPVPEHPDLQRDQGRAALLLREPAHPARRC
ncbi:Aerobic C4-dicarboxylate transport protein OS=Streptomyces violarus OX=67380 GN=FHS41_005580 PE=4 SV=1 [Streptomyces violarus]